jgi:hypothetical protein
MNKAIKVQSNFKTHFVITRTRYSNPVFFPSSLSSAICLARQ